MTITSEVVHITPECAQEWLEHNAVNRPLRKRQVDQNAEAMAAGLWNLNGESIKFDINGKLQDGQHRLTAVVQSGAAIDSFVIRGLQPQAQATMDSGAKRTLADQLAMEGAEDPILAAAIVRLSKAWHDGLRSTRNQPPVYNQAVLLQHLEEHPKLVKAAQLGRLYARQMSPGIGPVPVGFATYLLSAIDLSEMDEFMTDLAVVSPRQLPDGDPVLALRARLLQRVPLPRKTPLFRLGVLTRTWNARRDNRPMARFILDGREGTLERVEEPR